MMHMDPGAHHKTCAVHLEREKLLLSLADNPSDPYLLGALVEYYNWGDQESELCDCAWSPMGALATAILNAGDETDYTDVYEALRPFLDDVKFSDLGAAMDACPIHYCDIRICLDDEVHGLEVYR